MPMTTATRQASENEVTILARILGNESGQLPAELARYILELKLREEMYAFAKASTLLSILKSKARRTLGRKLESGTSS